MNKKFKKKMRKDLQKWFTRYLYLYKVRHMWAPIQFKTPIKIYYKIIYESLMFYE